MPPVTKLPHTQGFGNSLHTKITKFESKAMVTLYSKVKRTKRGTLKCPFFFLLRFHMNSIQDVLTARMKRI